MTLQWAAGLDMAGGSLEAGGTLVEVAINMDVAKFPVLKTGFMEMEVVSGKECVMVAASPPDFSVSDGGFLFLGQRG